MNNASMSLEIELVSRLLYFAHTNKEHNSITETLMNVTSYKYNEP